METIEGLNEKRQRVAFVYNHAPSNYLPLAPKALGAIPGSHLTLYWFHCLLNGKKPDVTIPFAPYELED